MDRKSGSKTSPGSEYFGQKSSINPTKKESLDFIGFEPDTPSKMAHTPSKVNFTPSSYSSPFSSRSPSYNQSPYNKSWHGNSHRGNYNSAFNQKGWSPQGKNNSWQGNSGSRRGGGNFRRNFSNRQSNKQPCNDEFDASAFLHSSFTENPWAELEKQLETNRNNESQNNG